ncbi:MAG: hypothetical protein GXY33_06905 [Phycisphaerae bacterium]|nr:hypothetical protein [Phycisphaerae bacterium]
MPSNRTIVMMLVLVCVIAHAAIAAPITDGMTFYAGFEEGLGPDNCAGAREAVGAYTAAEGKVGHGFENQSPPGARYVCAGNFTRAKGTLSFWIKPAIELGDRDRAIFSTQWFQLAAIAAHQVVYFMTGSTPPGYDYRWDWSCHVPVSALPKDRWTHVAITWDRNSDPAEGPAANLQGDAQRKARKKIYINGKLLASAEIDRIDGASEDGFSLGGEAPGVFDELAIWDRVLDLAEIARLCREPQAVAEELRALPPLTQEKRWQVYPELVYRDFDNVLVSPGEPFAFEAPIVNRTDREQRGRLVLTLLDLWEKPQGEPQTFEFALAPGGRQAFAVRFASDRTGIFKVEARVVIEGSEQWRDITSFGCVPPGDPPKHSFFGCHIQQTNRQETELAKRLGFSANRCHDQNQYTWWRNMEYERGKWTMVQKESHYDQLNALGIDHWGEWFAAPHWAVRLKDGRHPEPIAVDGYPRGWMPTDLEAYANYVRESVRRYDRIKNWEVWNEPWCSFFFEGSVEDYVTLCRVSAEAAKSVDPEVKVYANIDTSVWARAVLKAGALDHLDGISYHQYFGARDSWDTAVQAARQMRSTLAKFTDREIPLVFSEGGMSAGTFLRGLDFEALPPESRRPPMNFLQSAERIVQSYVSLMAEGVGHWFYYFHTTIGPQNAYEFYSTLEITNAPRTSTFATCILVWQLDGGTFFKELTPVDGLHVYLFDRNDGGSVAVAFAVDEAEAKVPYQGRAVDLMGNDIAHDGAVRIASTPVYLRHDGKAESLAALLEAAEIELVKPPVQAAEPSESGAKGPKPMPDFSIASELGPDRLIPLDVSAAANMALADEKAGDGEGGWTDEGPFNDLRDLAPGGIEWLGVPFRIVDPAANDGKAVVTMRGRTMAAGPLESPPIAVGRKVRGLFFAHAANYAQVSGIEAGAYEITYADGATVNAPIVLGANIWDWWLDHVEGEDSRTVTVRASQSLSEGTPYRFIRIWYWDNPRQDEPIESIRLKVRDHSEPTVVLLAVTAAVWQTGESAR